MISWDNSEEIVHTDDMDDFFNGFSEPERKNKIYRYGAYAAIIIGIWAFFRFLLPLVWPLVLAAAFVVPSASLMRPASVMRSSSHHGRRMRRFVSK